jgi:membrane-associated phospholipid phosphatase
MGNDVTARTGPLLTRRGVLLGGAGLAVSAALPVGRAAAADPRAGVPGQPAAVASSWVATTYDVVLQENLSPPAAARAYAMTAVAMYEAVVAGMPGHRSLARQLTDLTTVPPPPRSAALDWPTALVTAAAAVLRDVLPFAAPATRPALDAAERRALDDRRAAGVPARDRAAGVEHGRRVAKHLTRWIARDGYAGTVGREYTPPGDQPWSWESTPPNYRPAIEPYWSEVRPMVLRRADEVEPAPTVPFSTEPGSAFHDQAMAPYLQSTVNTDEHKAIARFWTDNPGSFTPPLGTPTGLPSGHWMLLAQQGLALRNADLALAVETYAMTGIALHDAFLNCWTWKYRFDLLRPITYVHRYIDPTWTTLVNTPQFPEHTSGHSVASAAAAAVLTAQLGIFRFTDHSHDVRGHRPRTFDSFSHAAAEAAQSRLYGGIHYPHGIEVGLAQGEQVGALVLARLQTCRAARR